MWRIASQSHGASPVSWDHTVLPATRHKWTRPALTPVSKLPTRGDGRLSWPRLPGYAPAANRTRDLCITNPTLWPLHQYHRAVCVSHLEAGVAGYFGMNLTAEIHSPNVRLDRLQEAAENPCKLNAHWLFLIFAFNFSCRPMIHLRWADNRCAARLCGYLSRLSWRRHQSSLHCAGALWMSSTDDVCGRFTLVV